MLVIFYGHGKWNGSRARSPYVHTYVRRISWHSYMRQIFTQLIANGMINWTLASHFFLTFHVNRSISLLLNFNLNDILRKICQKSRDEGEEKEIENNNGKRWETPLKNSVKQNRNKNEKDEEWETQREVGRTVRKNKARGKLRDADREL